MKNREIVTAFKKASASAGGTQDCVEVARTAEGGRAVRDSKDPGGGIQYYTPAGWAAFVAGVKAGAFAGQATGPGRRRRCDGADTGKPSPDAAWASSWSFLGLDEFEHPSGVEVDQR